MRSRPRPLHHAPSFRQRQMATTESRPGVQLAVMPAGVPPVSRRTVHFYRHQPSRSRMRRFLVFCDTSKRPTSGEGIEAMETEGILFSSGVVVLDSVHPPFLSLHALYDYLESWGAYHLTWLD